MAPASAQVTLNVSFDGTAVLKDTGIALDGVFADGFE